MLWLFCHSLFYYPEGIDRISLLKTIGKYSGKTAGIVVGGPIQVIGELTGSKVVEDIGKGVRKASEFAGTAVGEAVAASTAIAGKRDMNPIRI